MNPYPHMKDEEVLDSAEDHAKAQEVLAAQSPEDFTHWHHMGLAWLIRELAARLKDVKHQAP